MTHACPYTIIRSVSDAARPPQRLKVADGAAKNLKIVQAGGQADFWDPTETPYMVEPMNMLSSRSHEAVCFVGPARSGKTMGLLDGWVSHVVPHDPGDMLIVQMTQDKARDYSKTRIDRAIRNSPALSSLMSVRGHDDNTHDKFFRNGMWLKIGWPTATQLASSDYRYVALTDLDRMADDVGGEGSPFQLGLKRTTTYLSRGMCLAESSPGRPFADPRWRPSTAHEAPPCAGILGIYNRSDRRRLYWPCPTCGEFHQALPGLELFTLIPDEEELIRDIRGLDIDALASDLAKIACPHCGAIIGQENKTQMNARAAWLAEGETIGADRVRGGTPVRSTIAGFWLGGVSATYQNWVSLVSRYLQGLREFAMTGSELLLKTTTNTDQGAPYLSRLDRQDKTNDVQDRTEHLPRYVVPAAARFVMATVDVQGGQDARFVVQVHAHGPNHEQWLIDRYDIRKSARPGMGDDFAPIDPAGYPEDWDLLTEKCVKATYKCEGSDRELRVFRTGVDTGGEDGVTENAYDWWRRLARHGRQGRVYLLKGASGRAAALIKKSKVGGKKASKGDVDLYIINTNLLKDAVSAGLRRQDPGPGYLHLPDWLTAPFFDELNAETRLPNGSWKKIRKRNEAFDLTGYHRACSVILGVDKIRWDSPPAWAKPIDANSEAMSSDERREMKKPAAKPGGGFKKASMFGRR